MPDPVTGGVVGGANIVGSAYQGRQAKKASRRASASQERIAAAAEALNRERYEEAQEWLLPRVEQADIAQEQLMIEMGLAPGERTTAYMDMPGYDAALESAEQSAISSGSTLYGGRRLTAAADVGGQYYNNYMNMLQNIASPQVAQNLASLGVGQAATIGQQNIASGARANEYRMQGVEASNAAIADMMSGGMSVFTGAM